MKKFKLTLELVGDVYNELDAFHALLENIGDVSPAHYISREMAREFYSSKSMRYVLKPVNNLLSMMFGSDAEMSETIAVLKELEKLGVYDIYMGIDNDVNHTEIALGSKQILQIANKMGLCDLKCLDILDYSKTRKFWNITLFYKDGKVQSDLCFKQLLAGVMNDMGEELKQFMTKSASDFLNANQFSMAKQTFFEAQELASLFQQWNPQFEQYISITVLNKNGEPHKKDFMSLKPTAKLEVIGVDTQNRDNPSVTIKVLKLS